MSWFSQQRAYMTPLVHPRLPHLSLFPLNFVPEEFDCCFYFVKYAIALSKLVILLHLNFLDQLQRSCCEIHFNCFYLQFSLFKAILFQTI